MRRLIATPPRRRHFHCHRIPRFGGSPARHVSAEVLCLGAAWVAIDLTFENPGRRTARIDPDFHVLIRRPDDLALASA